jgi:5-methylcytosine-specific restriction endonuclease McrA
VARSSLTSRGSTWRWRLIRARILRRDGYVCGYCLRPATTVDHIVPRALGGGDEDTNLVAACTRCQNRKGGRPGGAFRSQASRPDTRALSARFPPAQNDPDRTPPSVPLAPRWSRDW